MRIELHDGIRSVALRIRIPPFYELHGQLQMQPNQLVDGILQPRRVAMVEQQHMRLIEIVRLFELLLEKPVLNRR
ncbi:hypothetical protein D3C78_1330810 [compost metagenome]